MFLNFGSRCNDPTFEKMLFLQQKGEERFLKLNARFFEKFSSNLNVFEKNFK